MYKLFIYVDLFSNLLEQMCYTMRFTHAFIHTGNKYLLRAC